MNLENLHELIQRYENSIDWIYGTEHDELFKWRAMATWRKEWLKPKDASLHCCKKRLLLIYG